jgi:ribonucleoside-diphosphate reductase alpha chain
MQIVKRDGTKEQYSKSKMLKFLTWACEGTNCDPKHILSKLIPPKEDTKVEDLLVLVYRTAEQMTTRLYTGWLYVSGRVYMVDLFKKHRSKGLDLISKSLSKDTLESVHYYLPEFDSVLDIAELFDINFDYSLPISDVKMLVEKQAVLLPNGIPEPPSLILMRQAIDASQYSKGKYTLSLAIKVYKALKAKLFTNATPMAISAGKQYRSTGSCVLMSLNDDSHHILDGVKEIGLHSKGGAGIGIDVSLIGGQGRPISTSGSTSSGVKPFLKIIESTLAAFDQGGKRKGSGVITFPWWHIDYEELVYLKNNKGLPEQRIRGLKYSLVVNDHFFQLCDEDGDAVLVCPNQLIRAYGFNPLVDCSGKSFTRYYNNIKASVKSNRIEGKIVKAKYLMKLYLENLFDHGHLYTFFKDNANKQNMLSAMVNSSNLCQEVVIPSIRNDSETLTGLCFLNSTNIYGYYKATKAERSNLLKMQLEILINQIMTDYYPVPNTTLDYNQNNRFVGIGMSNLATLFAQENISFNSQEALELMDEITEDWSFNIILASVQLTDTLGVAPDFYKSKWAEGKLPYDFANESSKQLTKHEPNYERWDWLKDQVRKKGMANTLLMAIAPTASSSGGSGSTEGIEPVIAQLWTRTGAVEVTATANRDQAVLNQYTLAYDCENTQLIKLAAVRQKWVDQGQSINLYVKGTSYSMSTAYEERKYANSLGIKSLYYVKFKKGDANEEQCDSCT